jgi:hypothetical protein
VKLKRAIRRTAALATIVLAGACSSSGSSSPADTSLVNSTGEEAAAPGESTPGETTPGGSTAPSESTPSASTPSKLKVPAGAVTIDYFVVTDQPLVKETLVPLEAPTKTVSMLVDKITYAGVVCGFSFTGAERPQPPVTFRVVVEEADGTLVDGEVQIGWNGDQEEAGSDANGDWNFLSDAQPNRNGPGWVVQVGALPIEGGKDRTPPKRATCELTSSVDITPASGPIAYWAGFAAV